MDRVPLAPNATPFFGHMKLFTSDTLNYLLTLRDCGDIVRIRFGPFPFVVVSHPDLARQVLVTDAKSYDKSRVTKAALSDSAGKGLFTNDGEPWKRQRKLVQPAFHTQRIAAYADTMVSYTNALADTWRDGQTLELEHEMTTLTMRIVTKTLFDVDLADDTDDIGATITEVFHITNQRFNRLAPIPRWLPIRENRVMKKMVAKLDSIVHRFIDEWRKTGVDKGDLLSMLLLAMDDDDGGGMSDRQVRDEALTLFVAGHETTANTLIWVWYLLSQHPEIEAKLHAELESVLGDRLPTYDDLEKLVYTEMIIKEAMRLYPPAFMVTREPNEPVTLGGYALPAGTSLGVNIYGMHRDARFFPEPDRFDPERFSAENEKHIPKYAYIPFGAGPRVCIGNSFAMMEAKLVVATLARRFHLSHAPGHIAEPTRVFTMRPKYGMAMIAHPRAHEPMRG